MSDAPDPVGAAFAAAAPFGEPPAPEGPSAGGAGAPPPPAAPEVDPEAVRDCLGLPLNDYGNGQRLKRHFGDDLVFVPRVGWFVWDGVRWAPDEDQMRLASVTHRVADAIRAEAEEIEFTEEEREAVAAWEAARDEFEAAKAVPAKSRTAEEAAAVARGAALKAKAAPVFRRVLGGRDELLKAAVDAGNSGPIAGMIKQASPYLYRRIDEMNADPLLVTVEGATLRFAPPRRGGPGEDFEATVEALAPRREDRITKLAPVPWIGEAAAEGFRWDPKTAPVFDRFLRAIQPAEEIRAFLQRWFGYSMLGLTSEQKLVFLYGIGRNGKSTLVDIVARILGDYATTLPIETLTGDAARKGADATPDLVRLPGARMVRASEPEEGVKLKEALIKALTGGEEVLMRRMREEFVSFRPEFKLTISGNHKPAVRGTDDGIWRRLLLVPFETQVPAAQVDPALPEKLWAERSGILGWLAEGALLFLDGGLAAPDAVREATAEFREERDPMRRFLDGVCEATGDPEDRIAAAELVAAFGFWQRDNGEAAWGERAISNALRDRAEPRPTWRSANGRTFGFTKSSKVFYTGLRLDPDFLERFRADRAKGGK